MSRPTPRRPSRITTPKPRKIAGRDTAADAPEDSASGSAPAAANVSAQPPRPSPPQGPPKGPPRPVAKPPADGGEGGGDGARGPGWTSTLLAVLGLVVLLLVLQAGWFVWNSVRDVEVAVEGAPEGSSEGSDDARDPITVPSDRPVVLNEVAVQGGVEAAATAAQTMFARNWQTYDDGVDAALELMTDTFAEDYASTTADVRQQFIRKKTDVQVRVVAQGVVRANDSELEALIFLNQYTIRGEGPDARTTYSPYRALMTMVHTDRGWLVDGVDTK